MSSLNTASRQDGAIGSELVIFEKMHRFDILQAILYEIQYKMIVGKVAWAGRKNSTSHWILANRERALGWVPLYRAAKVLLDQPAPYQWGLCNPGQIGLKPLLSTGKPEWRYGVLFWMFAIFVWGIAACIISVFLVIAIGETLPVWANLLAAVAFAVVLQRIPIKRPLLSVKIPDACENQPVRAETENSLPKTSPCVAQFSDGA